MSARRYQCEVKYFIATYFHPTAKPLCILAAMSNVFFFPLEKGFTDLTKLCDVSALYARGRFVNKGHLVFNMHTVAIFTRGFFARWSYCNTSLTYIGIADCSTIANKGLLESRWLWMKIKGH